MKLLFDESFEKSIKKLDNKQLKKKIINLIEVIEKAERLAEISNVKKMQGFQKYYRIRIGEYRLGFEMIDAETILFILVSHRKDIYKYFP
jgi:mRNA interferase RelE/StbE